MNNAINEIKNTLEATNKITEANIPFSLPFICQWVMGSNHILTIVKSVSVNKRSQTAPGYSFVYKHIDSIYLGI